jgi:RNA polymerase sigma factor (sigma-70 family)
MSASAALASYVHLRPRLFNIAYRMLGSVSDADDVVQDTWLRWERSASTAHQPEAVMVTIATRLCLDRLKHSSRRRTDYVGAWLPEPLLASESNDPLAILEHQESLGYAALVLLHELDELSRAVIVLHDMFGVPFAEVSDIVERTPAAVRQIAHRARQHMAAVDNANISTSEFETAVMSFLGALASGDAMAAAAACSPSIVHVSDGGGVVRAATHPIIGVDRVVRFNLNLNARYVDRATVDPVTANGTLSIRVNVDGSLSFFDLFGATRDADGVVRVHRVWRLMEPRKLASVESPRRAWR